MTVKGGREVAKRLTGFGAKARAFVDAALEDVADDMLQDMKARTPRDPASRGPHAVDALTVVKNPDGEGYKIGLPTEDLVSDFFWFRFLDQGTAGGTVTYRTRRSTKRYEMAVPPRPALRILENTLDANRARLLERVEDAIEKASR